MISERHPEQPLTQKFCIDGADLVECIAQPAKVAEPFGDLFAGGIWYIFSVRSAAGLTDHQIPLGAMSWTIATVTGWSTASLVGLGQRAAQQAVEWRQVAQQLAAAFSKG